MMKAFFVKLSHQIEKSDIPEGTTMPVAVDLPPEEPEEVIKLKEEIESMKSQLEKKNDSIQSLLSQINEHFRLTCKVPCLRAHLQSSVFKLSKDLIDSIHEEGIVAYTS